MGTLTPPHPVCGGAEDWLYPQTKGLRGVLSTQPSASWFWNRSARLPSYCPGMALAQAFALSFVVSLEPAHTFVSSSFMELFSDS